MQTSYSSPKSESNMLPINNVRFASGKCFSHPFGHLGDAIYAAEFCARSCTHVFTYVNTKNISLSRLIKPRPSQAAAARRFFTPPLNTMGQLRRARAISLRFASVSNFAHALRERCISKCIVGGDAKVLLDRIQKPNGVMEKRV